MKRVNLKEHQYMNDNDIAAQYGDMKITYFEINRLRNSSTGWEGTFELEFPNADGVDYDETMVNNFIVYDEVGKRIAWDNWMPKAQTDKLENIIRQEISKKVQNESLRRIRTIVSETVKRVLRESEGQLFGLTKMQGEELWDVIDNSLQHLGDVYVSRFYSDKNQITIATNRNIGREGRKEIIEIMKNFGYDFNTSGTNDEYIMMTFS